MFFTTAFVSSTCSAEAEIQSERLANSLQTLLKQSEGLSKAGELKGITHHLSVQNQLPKPWYVLMPRVFDLPSVPAPLEQAIYSSLTDYPFKEGESVMLDITHLGSGDSQFFTDDPNILKKLDNIIETYDITLTIRYLEGNPSQGFTGHGDGNKNPIAQQFKDLADRHPRHVKLYFGSLAPGVFSKHSVNNAGGALGSEGVVQSLHATLSKSADYTIIPKVDFDQMIRAALGYLFSADAISWNHSKIVALNGVSLIEGGANYWAEYQKGSGSPFDLAMRVNGPAAVDAHRFCNTLWGFLTQHPGLPFNSCQRYNTSMKVFEAMSDVPLFNEKPIPQGNVQILAANTLGAWESADLSETMVLPAVDLVASMAYSYLKSRGEENAFPLVVALLYGDAYSSFYTARYLRKQAIANARSTIKFSQQKFVMDDLLSKLAFKSLIAFVNTALDMQWDGILWPYDVIATLANTVKHSSFKTVDIVTSFYTPPGYGGYQDPLKASEFTGMLSLFAGQPVDKKVNYRRISDTPKIANHAKLMIIDAEQPTGQLINIGSENMYPSYNQQFTLWLEDAEAIKVFMEEYWSPLWRYSVAS